MRGMLVRAVVLELASERKRAVGSGCALGLWPFQYFARSRGNPGPPLNDVAQLRRDVDVHGRSRNRAGEWTRDAATRVADNCCRDAKATSARDPNLRRDVPNMVLTNSRRAFDLNQRPAAPAVRLQDVRSDNDVLMLQSSFEYRPVPGARQEGSGFHERLFNPPGVGVQEYAIWHLFPGKLPKAMADSKDQFGARVDHRQLAPIYAQPESLLAMLEARKLALGQSQAGGTDFFS